MVLRSYLDTSPGAGRRCADNDIPLFLSARPPLQDFRKIQRTKGARRGFYTGGPKADGAETPPKRRTVG